MVELTLPSVDFKRDKQDIPAIVQRIIRFWKYPIPLVELKYADGEIRHILAPIGLRPGDTVIASENAPLKPGNVLPLKSIPIGVMIHNVERQPGKGGQLVRAAGSAAQVVSKENGICVIQLPSGHTNTVALDCRATIGRLSHISLDKLKPLVPQAIEEIADETEVTLQQEQKAVASDLRLAGVGTAPVEQENGFIQSQPDTTVPQAEGDNIPQQAQIQQIWDDAELSSDRMYIGAVPGEHISFNLVARNKGNSTWAAEKGYRLGWLRGYEYFTFEKRLKLDFDSRESIDPGVIKVWRIMGMVVPQEVGTYAMSWQMCHEESLWFGNKLIMQVQVKAADAKPAAETAIKKSPSAYVKATRKKFKTTEPKPAMPAPVKPVKTATDKEGKPAKVKPAKEPIVTAGEKVSLPAATVIQPQISLVEEKKLKAVTEPQHVKIVPVAQEKPSAMLEKPLVIVQPPIGPSKTRFKVMISRCMPKKDIILSYEAYAIGSGWKIETRKLGTDKVGAATANLSWGQSGTYDVWVKDKSTNLESRITRVIVL